MGKLKLVLVNLDLDCLGNLGFGFSNVLVSRHASFSAFALADLRLTGLTFACVSSTGLTSTGLTSTDVTSASFNLPCLGLPAVGLSAFGLELVLVRLPVSGSPASFGSFGSFRGFSNFERVFFCWGWGWDWDCT